MFYFMDCIYNDIKKDYHLKKMLHDQVRYKGIMVLFGKSELYSKILAFILAITFSLSAFDWIMSIDVHWYSTIFALKNLVAAFLHGVSILTLIVFILYKRGYFPFLNKFHMHDFARYIFHAFNSMGIFLVCTVYDNLVREYS